MLECFHRSRVVDAEKLVDSGHFSYVIRIPFLFLFEQKKVDRVILRSCKFECLHNLKAILSNQLHPTIIFQSQRCAASNTFNFFRKNLKNSAKISENVFSYTIGGLKASEKENSVLCLYRIGEAAPRPEIRERAKMRENILHWP